MMPYLILLAVALVSLGTIASTFRDSDQEPLEALLEEADREDARRRRLPGGEDDDEDPGAEPPGGEDPGGGDHDGEAA